MSYNPPGRYTPPNAPRKPPQQFQQQNKNKIPLRDLVDGIKAINRAHPNASPLFREQILINLLLGYIGNPDLNMLIWQQGFGDAFSDFNRMSVGQKPLH